MSEILNIDHEAGDLSEYSSTVTDGGDLSVASGAALASTNEGLSVLIDDTTSIYGRADYTQLGVRSDCRYRFYLDPNSLTMSDTDFHVICRTLNGTSQRTQVQFGWLTASGFRIRAMATDDGGTNQATSWVNISDAEQYVEVLIQYASGVSADDGVVRLWVDGSQVADRTDVDLYTRNSSDSLRLGAVANVDAGTSGTYYLDQLILNDDGGEIGAHDTTRVRDIIMSGIIPSPR